MNYVILLTGCINPNGMSFTSLSDKNIRMEQYIASIDFYLGHTIYPIIFAENSGTNLSEHYAKDVRNIRLEILSFEGNSNKKKGKGYGEAEILDYVLKNSQTIKSMNGDYSIIKITGRLIVRNINKVIEKKIIFQHDNSIIVSFNSTFSFADSRIIIAPADFFTLFLQHKELINDSNNHFFEDVLAECIIREKNYHYYPFYVEPQIIGQSGTTGEYYYPKAKTISYRIRYLVYIFRTLTRFYNKKSNKRISPYLINAYKFIYYFLYINEKILQIPNLLFKTPQNTI